LQSVARRESVRSPIPRELRGVHPPEALLVGGGLIRAGVSRAGVYVGQFDGSAIGAYDVPNPANKAPVCSVSGIAYANGIGVNAAHVLYDPDGGTRTLITFAAHCGKMLSAVPIPAGTDNQPADVAFDEASKTAYVDTVEDGVYPIKFASTTFGNPLTCNSYSSSFSVAVDNKGDVFASGAASSGSIVVEFVKGKGACKTLAITGVGTAVGLIVDTKGNLIDIDLSAGILIWAPPYKGAPKRVIPEKGESVYGKLDEAGDTLYVSDFANGSVDVFRYRAGTYAYSWTNGLAQSEIVEGIAADPPQP
jgi:hypothetical protein